MQDDTVPRMAIPTKSRSAKPSVRSAKPAARGAVKASAAKASTAKDSTIRAKLISSKLAYTGKSFSVYTDTVVEPGGYRAIRDVVRHNGSVVILAVDAADAADPRILLVRQYRHAAGQFLLELPAGHIDAGEAPLAAARRELTEETGFRARCWNRMVRYFASPGFLGESMHIYLAEDIREGTAQPEEDEKIELQWMPLSELLSMIEAGKIHDGKTIIGLLLYAAKRRSATL
jgi:ADP-ribose pyrophosphatase